MSVPCYLQNAGCAVGAGFNRGAGGLPEQEPGNTYAAPFRCVIPRDMPAGGGRALLYGHGLLGSPLDSDDSAQAQLKTLAHQQGFTVCGTYWSGLSDANGGEDTGQAAAAIQDLSKFGAITDRLQQGMLNMLFLGRAMVAADGFRAQPAFAGAFDASQRLFYDGNSQGGIEGGALTAIAPDFDRAVLGVVGMNYSTLLQRSVDFAPFRALLDAAYRNPLDRILIYSLLTNLWDRGESNGYAQHMTTKPLPRTPPHEVLLHVALGDHQVAPVTAEVMARTIGARVWDKLDPGRSADVKPFWGIPSLSRFPSSGSALVVFDSGPVTRGEPAGHPAAAGDEHAAVRGHRPARVPAPDAGGADDEGPVPPRRRPAAVAALRRRGLPLERLDRPLDGDRRRRLRRAAGAGAPGEDLDGRQLRLGLRPAAGGVSGCTRPGAMRNQAATDARASATALIVMPVPSASTNAAVRGVHDPLRRALEPGAGAEPVDQPRRARRTGPGGGTARGRAGRPRPPARRARRRRTCRRPSGTCSACPRRRRPWSGRPRSWPPCSSATSPRPCRSRAG